MVAKPDRAEQDQDRDDKEQHREWRPDRPTDKVGHDRRAPCDDKDGPRI